jgi:hypothetical protein
LAVRVGAAATAGATAAAAAALLDDDTELADVPAERAAVVAVVALAAGLVPDPRP